MKRVGRPRSGERQTIALARQPASFTTGERLKRTRSRSRNQKRRVEQQRPHPAPAARSPTGALPNVRAPPSDRTTPQRFRGRARPAPSATSRCAFFRVRYAAPDARVGSSSPGRLRGGGRARAIQDNAHAPLVMVRQALHEGIDPCAIAAHVFERPLVAVEDREQLHRQHGRCLDERFDDAFVRDRRARHPVEIGQATLDRFFAVARERRVGDHQKQSAVEVEHADRSRARQSSRPRAGRGRSRAATRQ